MDIAAYCDRCSNGLNVGFCGSELAAGSWKYLIDPATVEMQVIWSETAVVWAIVWEAAHLPSGIP